MKNSSALLLLAAIVCTILPFSYADQVCSADVGTLIDGITSKPQYENLRWGIHAQAYFPQPYPSGDIVQELYSKGEAESFVPASNTKLFTTAAAVNRYSSDFAFETKVLGDIPEDSGYTPEEWNELTPVGGPTAGRMYAKASLTSTGAMYLFGGMEQTGARRNDIQVYNPSTNAWTLSTPSGPVPSARYAHTQVITSDDQLFIFGGSSTAGRLNDIHRYDVASNTFRPLNVSNVLPKPAVRTLACGVATRFGTLLFFGGSQGYAKFFNDVWKFDIASNTWTLVQPSGTLPTPRSGMSCVMDGDVMVVFGGHISSTTKLNSVLKYDTATDAWLTVPTPSGIAPTVRTTHAGAITDDRVLLVFGGVGPSTDLDSIAKYDIANNAWLSATPIGTPPSPRDSPVAVYDPSSSRFIIWGGIGTSYFTDMYSYKYIRVADAEQMIATATSDTICFVGSGDPTMTTGKLQGVINGLAARGIRGVRNLYVDGTKFLGNYEPGSWEDDLLLTNNAPSPGPFVINRNLFTFRISPGDKPGDFAKITFPDLLEKDAPIIINHVHTTAVKTDITISYVFGAGSTERGLLIQGQIQLGSAPITKSDIPAYPSVPRAANVLKNIFAAANVQAQNVHLAACPSGQPLITTIKSPSLYEIISPLLKDSDNLYAEEFLRSLGSDSPLAYNDTVQSGIAEVKRILGASLQGVQLNEWTQADGSGLSILNSVTPRSVVSLLAGMKNSGSVGSLWKSFLPVAGVSGTLATRFPQGTPGYSVVSAKTGTLTGVSALSGYVTKCREPLVAFSILVNRVNESIPVSYNTMRAGIDEVANVLASWSSTC